MVANGSAAAGDPGLRRNITSWPARDMDRAQAGSPAELPQQAPCQELAGLPEWTNAPMPPPSLRAEARQAEISATAARGKSREEGHATKHGQDSKTDPKSVSNRPQHQERYQDRRETRCKDRRQKACAGAQKQMANLRANDCGRPKLTSHIRINVLAAIWRAGSFTRPAACGACPLTRMASSRRMRASAASPPVVS